jgi:hypothetical protein
MEFHAVLGLMSQPVYSLSASHPLAHLPPLVPAVLLTDIIKWSAWVTIVPPNSEYSTQRQDDALGSISLCALLYCNNVARLCVDLRPQEPPWLALAFSVIGEGFHDAQQEVLDKGRASSVGVPVLGCFHLYQVGEEKEKGYPAYMCCKPQLSL